MYKYKVILLKINIVSSVISKIELQCLATSQVNIKIVFDPYALH